MNFTIDTTKGTDLIFNIRFGVYPVNLTTEPGATNAAINWGDGTALQNVTSAVVVVVPHTYATHGVYHISITGNFSSFGYYQLGTTVLTPGMDKLVSVEDFGSHNTKIYAFQGATNLVSVPTVLPTSVLSCRSMFRACTSFNHNIGGWDMSRVTAIDRMFMDAVNFNQDIGGWDMSEVTNFIYSFVRATSFNQDLPWDTSSCTNLNNMFDGATSFNGLIPWDTSKVTNMTNFLSGAISFNKPVIFNLPAVVSTAGVPALYQVFKGCTSFNSEVSLTIGAGPFTAFSTFEMFQGCTSFEGNNININTESFTQPHSMFLGCTRFNGDISGWDMSKAVDVDRMFEGCTAFNQPIGSWDVSKVQDMPHMFLNASSFNQDLSSWDVSSVAYSMTNLFNGSGMSEKNYSATIIGWSMQNLKPNIPFSSTSVKYLDYAQPAIDKLKNTFGWTITNAGPEVYAESNKLVLNVDTTLPGSASNIFDLPLYTSGAYDFVIEWGDGTVEIHKTSGTKRHTYATSGTYDAKIIENKTGGFGHIYFNGNGDRLKLKALKQWGTLTWGSFLKAFKGCSNMRITATDSRLAKTGVVTNFNEAWASCSSLNDAPFPLLNMRGMTDGTGCFSSVRLSTESYSTLLEDLLVNNPNIDVPFNGGLSTYKPSISSDKEELTTSKSWAIQDNGQDVNEYTEIALKKRYMDDTSVTVKATGASITYFVVVPKGSVAPTSVQVSEGKGSDGIVVPMGRRGTIYTASNVESVITAYDLQAYTSYDMYIVSEV